jgi:hypothetical protein
MNRVRGTTRVLYSSSEIHVRVKHLFSEPREGDSRIALVAYVGSDGESYLPHPAGLRLICSPTAGGTDPETLRSLIKRGARVQFSDALHMKVYSALGRSGLKEAGVWLPRGVVDVRRLIRYAMPRDVTRHELRKLDESTKEQTKHQGQRGRDRLVPNFLSWFSSPHRSAWKLAWGDEEISGTAKAAKEAAFSEYGRREPYSWQSAAAGRVKKNDWLLCFTFAAGGIKAIKWQFVDFVVGIDRRERRFYYRCWPFHAVQVHSPSRYPLPPFRITPEFRAAFRRAVDSDTELWIKSANTDRPPASLLRRVAAAMRSVPSQRKSA